MPTCSSRPSATHRTPCSPPPDCSQTASPRALVPAPDDPARDRLATLLLFHGLADRAHQEESRNKVDIDRPRFVQTLERALLGLYRTST